MHSKIAIRSVAVVAAAVLLLGNPKPARADHPLMDIAIIVAGGAFVVGTAVIVAGGIVAAAILLDDDSSGGDCECPETRGEGEGEGEEGGGEGEGGEGGGGTEQGQKTMRPPALVFQSAGASVSGSALRPAATAFDDAGTHPGVTSFIDRRGELRVDRLTGGHVAAVGEYHFDGDIRRAPQGLRKFTHDESLLFDVKVDTRTIQDARACTAITLKNLRLSTEDVPRTDGSVKMSIDVIQNGVTTSTRELLVQKGLVPQRPAWATGPGWVFAKDRIDLTSVVLPVPCTPDPNGMPTQLKIAVKTKFIGERE
jgi:hypothetical protein